MRAAAVGIVAALLYVRLGIAVSDAPPGALDLAGRAFAGEAPGLAVVFTASCWWESLIALAVVMIAVAVRFPAWRPRVAFAVPLTLIAWQISNALKDVFGRPRPEYWIRIHETSLSYSSGHAMFATIVYWLWAFFFWKSDLPARLRVPLAVAAALWGCGVIWSRLALGAHYVTDLAGGVLLGITLICAGILVRAALRALWPGSRSPVPVRRNA